MSNKPLTLKKKHRVHIDLGLMITVYKSYNKLTYEIVSKLNTSVLTIYILYILYISYSHQYISG